jgi:hypothetical protein
LVGLLLLGNVIEVTRACVCAHHIAVAVSSSSTVSLFFLFYFFSLTYTPSGTGGAGAGKKHPSTYSKSAAPYSWVIYCTCNLCDDRKEALAMPIAIPGFHRDTGSLFL